MRLNRDERERRREHHIPISNALQNTVEQTEWERQEEVIRLRRFLSDSNPRSDKTRKIGTEFNNTSKVCDVLFVWVGIMIKLRRIIVSVDERKSLKFVLIDRTNHVGRDWRQNWLFFREFGVEI